jgi:hypothetical protein
VPVYLFRKVSRGVDLGVVLAFLHSEERFVFMENEKCPNGRALHGRYLGGVGLTMFEWLHVPGFLEVVVRCERTRRRIREALRAWWP